MSLYILDTLLLGLRVELCSGWQAVVLVRRAVLIRISSVIVSTSDLANRGARKSSFWVGFLWDVGKLGLVPSSSSDGMRPFGPNVSFTALIAIPSALILYGDLWELHKTLKSFRKGWGYRSPRSVELCASMPLYRSSIQRSSALVWTFFEVKPVLCKL